MSIPMMSATSGSSARRCTTSAPHQRATPVTRTRLFFEGTTPPVYEAGPSVRLRRSCSLALVRALDDVAFHDDHGLRGALEQRRFGLSERELELAQKRVDGLHRLDGIADVDVRRQRDLVQRLARRPPVGEVDVVVRRRA